MPGHNRRDFLARTAGFLAAAAVAKLPVIPEPEPVIEPTVEPEPEIIHRFMNGDTPGVVTFKVFGRSTIYSIPGVRR